VRLTSGTVLAERYRLTALLGQGGMGEVWAARHVLTGKAVAVKRLVCPADERRLGEARARFALEARSACAIEHPNVVEVFDFIQDDERAPFIVMELLRGETLAARLARGPFGSAREAAALLLPVVSAVGSAHARGIVHRDLKPSNIFMDARPGDGGRLLVKVLDFGIAKWLSGAPEDGGLRTRTGSTLGTPSYMAPEQAIGDRNADHRVDIWSLGVILYEALSGVRPLEGDNAAQLVMRLLSTGIMPIEHLVPELPPELSALIGRMLARDVARRPADLREVHELLATLSGETSLPFGAPPPREDGALPRSYEPLVSVSAALGKRAALLEPLAVPGPDTALLETHTAIELNTGALAASEGLQGRGRRLRPLSFALLAGLVLLGGALWLAAGPDAPLAARAAPASAEGARAGAESARAGAAEASGLAPRALAGETPPAPLASDVGRPGGTVATRPSPSAREMPVEQTQRPSSPRTNARVRREAASTKRPPRAPASGALVSRTRLTAPEARPAPLAQGRARGSECESSSECSSGLCVAYSCQ